jgi:hypothetical protein
LILLLHLDSSSWDQEHDFGNILEKNTGSSDSAGANHLVFGYVRRRHVASGIASSDISKVP